MPTPTCNTRTIDAHTYIEKRNISSSAQQWLFPRDPCLLDWKPCRCLSPSSRLSDDSSASAADLTLWSMAAIRRSRACRSNSCLLICVTGRKRKSLCSDVHRKRSVPFNSIASFRWATTNIPFRQANQNQPPIVSLAYRHSETSNSWEKGLYLKQLKVSVSKIYIRGPGMYSLFIFVNHKKHRRTIH